MIYSIRVGPVKAERLETWTENNNPFDILENWCEINGIGWITFLSEAEVFSDK